VKQGKIDDAVASFEEALKWTPSDQQTRKSLGQIYLMQERPLKAVEHLRAVVVLDPTDVEACFNLAVAYQMAGHKDEAITFYKQFISLAESSPDWIESVEKAGKALYSLENEL